MSSAGAPDPSPSASPSTGRALAVALARGAVAFVLVGSIGQLIGIVDATVFRPPEAPTALFARLGWLEFELMNGVPVRLDARGLGLAPTGSSSAHLQVGVCLLLGTWLAAWLLFRGGRAVAEVAGGGAIRRAIAGASVAVAYAGPSFLLSLLVRVPLRFSSDVVFAGVIEARADPVRALVLPLGIGAVAGVLGGLSSAGSAMPEERRVGRVSAALAGGWWMFGVALAVTYAGLFIAGVVRPDGAIALLTPTTGHYFEVAFERPGFGWPIVIHHVAVSPEEALGVLVPAMGGCDVLDGATGRPFLCYWRFPRAFAPAAGLGSLLGTGSDLGLVFGTAPWPFFLFVLAPASATILGGRWAARRAAARGRVAVVVGAASGIVFAVLVVAVGYLGSVTVEIETNFSFLRSAAYRIGPDLLSGGALALAWGVVGGALGGAIATRSRPLSR